MFSEKLANYCTQAVFLAQFLEYKPAYFYLMISFLPVFHGQQSINILIEKCSKLLGVSKAYKKFGYSTLQIQ
jgi:hypothetical protein